MTTPFLTQDIARDEGCRLVAYPDPLTKAAPWTIGYGHCGKEVHPGLEWTHEQARAALLHDICMVEVGLDSATPWWEALDHARQDVLVNLGFNLGLHGLLGFHHMLAALKAGDYAKAAEELLKSEAARELPQRYARLYRQLLSGERQP